MSHLHELRSVLLHDRKITDDEVAIIQRYIHEDGKLDFDDMKFLVELLCDATEVCPEFDALFFPTLEAIILEDGRIGTDEHFLLLKMLYSDGHVRDSEKEFLLHLRNELDEVTPEFEAMCEEALAAHPTNWDTGGQ